MIPPLVLLPGTLCDATLFEHQVRYLSTWTRPLALEVHHHDTLAEVARSILEQVEGTFALAGLSYGGIVAFEIWRQAPYRVAKLALLNTNPHEASPPTRERQQRMVGMAVLGEFRAITTDYLKDAMLHPAHQTNLALRQHVLRMAESVGKDGFLNQIKAQLNRPSSLPILSQITCPTLVLAGQEDRVTPLALHVEMADALPNSHLVVLEQCGHLSTLEQPEAVNHALRDWLTDEGIWKKERYETESPA